MGEYVQHNVLDESSIKVPQKWCDPIITDWQEEHEESIEARLAQKQLRKEWGGGWLSQKFLGFARITMIATKKEMVSGRTEDWIRNVELGKYISGRISKVTFKPIATFSEHQLAEIEGTFSKLASKWRNETASISSVTRKAMHPAYQRIIGMGQDAITPILRELQKRPGHWLWALNAITGEDPAKPDDTFNEAVQAWLKWGKDRGYI